MPSAGKAIAAVAACCLWPAAAGTWKVESKSCELSAVTGSGKLGGPVSFSSERWTITATREALVSAKSRIVKTRGEEAGYRLDTSPIRVIFLGQCQAKDASGKVILEAPFLILDLKEGEISGSGPGMICHSEDGVAESSGAGDTVVIDLGTDDVSPEGEGWSARRE